jgi:hypothetical protein
MKALIIFSFIVFVAYTVATIVLFGILPSLSASYYKWEEKYKCGWLFSATMFTMAVTLLPAWLTLSEGSTFQFLSFLCPASLIFVGAAPKFETERLEKWLHPIAAIICAVCAILWLLFVGHLWWVVLISLIVFLAIALLTKTLIKSAVFWFEMIAFVATYNGLFALLIIK